MEFKPFTALCDFQYLPMEKKADGPDDKPDEQDEFVSILEKAVPQKLETLDWLEEADVPIFMSPPLFSRMDVPVVSLTSQYVQLWYDYH